MDSLPGKSIKNKNVAVFQNTRKNIKENKIKKETEKKDKNEETINV